MLPAGMGSTPDPWAQWLTERRDASDEHQRRASLDRLGPIRDRVLDQAGGLEGATVLDVGCGDGLIGLAALERVGPGGAVIFSDISPALLDKAEQAARDRGLADRARFVRARAEELAVVADSSVDVVMSFDSFLDGAPNPLAPTLRETIEQALTEDERQQLLEHLREKFASTEPTQLWAGAYLAARRAA
jgi:SAM-dependent methyltransferase